MTRKPHQIIWHKKKSKFVSAAYLKEQDSPFPSSEPNQKTATEKKADKIQSFSQQLSSAIKKAIREARAS